MTLQEKIDLIFKHYVSDEPEEDQRHTIDFESDCDKIIADFKKSRGVDVSRLQAASIWAWYSEDQYCAGWLMLDYGVSTKAIDLFVKEFYWQCFEKEYPNLMVLK
jgi:hypothetical protein